MTTKVHLAQAFMGEGASKRLSSTQISHKLQAQQLQSQVCNRVLGCHHQKAKHKLGSVWLGAALLTWGQQAEPEAAEHGGSNKVKLDPGLHPQGLSGRDRCDYPSPFSAGQATHGGLCPVLVPTV